MWSRIRYLVIKEILAVWRDKRSRLALIVAPIAQLLILSNAATLEVKNIHLGYYNQDAGYYSQELVKRFSGSSYFTEVQGFPSAEKLHDALDRQEIIAALQMQPDFSRNVEKAKGADVLVILDGRKSNAAQIVGGYINQVVDGLNSDIRAAKGANNTSRVSTTFRSWFNPQLDYLQYNVPCMIAILSMLISLLVTSLSVAREREMGTFDQLLVSPYQPWQILVGKALPAVAISIVESTLIMIIAMIIFGVRFHGSIPLFYGSMAIFVTATVGVGLFISSLSQTQQQAQLGTFIFMVPNIIMSGFSTPVENMPSWLQPVSELLPITHFLIIVKGIFLKGMGAQEILTNAWPMALIALVTLSTASWMFKRRME